MTTWTPAAKPSETWATEKVVVRVFDPSVFDNNPIFDTGTPAGVWNAAVKQSETWSNQP